MKAHRPILAGPELEQQSQLPALAALIEAGFEGWDRGNDFVQEMINGDQDHDFPGEFGGILGELMFPGGDGVEMVENTLPGGDGVEMVENTLPGGDGVEMDSYELLGDGASVLGAEEDASTQGVVGDILDWWLPGEFEHKPTDEERYAMGDTNWGANGYHYGYGAESGSLRGPEYGIGAWAGTDPSKRADGMGQFGFLDLSDWARPWIETYSEIGGWAGYNSEGSHGVYGGLSLAGLEFGAGDVGGETEDYRKAKVDIGTAEAGLSIGKDSAYLGASAALIQGAITMGDIGSSKHDEELRAGLALGAGFGARAHYGDTDNDGKNEYGFGVDFLIGTMDIKTEDPLLTMLKPFGTGIILDALMDDESWLGDKLGLDSDSNLTEMVFGTDD